MQDETVSGSRSRRRKERGKRTYNEHVASLLNVAFERLDLAAHVFLLLDGPLDVDLGIGDLLVLLLESGLYDNGKEAEEVSCGRREEGAWKTHRDLLIDLLRLLHLRFDVTLLLEDGLDVGRLTLERLLSGSELSLAILELEFDLLQRGKASVSWEWRDEKRKESGRTRLFC